MKHNVTIGITDCAKYRNYEKWMSAEPNAEVIKLSYKNNFEEIRKCDGIVLTGGEDVHPRFYGSPEYLAYCEQDNMDEKRDEFELKVVEYSQRNQIPVLGICRGLQITNVFFGGSLVPDIPSFGKKDHTRHAVDKDRYHDINIEPNSILRGISGSIHGEVNSSHHQAAEKIGKGLVASAFSEDGVVEAIERESGVGKPFLLLVQWHPERMKDQESSLVRKIKMSFLENTRLD